MDEYERMAEIGESESKRLMRNMGLVFGGLVLVTSGIIYSGLNRLGDERRENLRQEAYKMMIHSEKYNRLRELTPTDFREGSMRTNPEYLELKKKFETDLDVRVNEWIRND